jgi:hypothetical protein
MSIQIHGKEYITVAERVQEAHKELENLEITTEVLYQEPVVVKATVITKKGTFTGISAANPSKAIEKMSPYEVAETSAVGRALGFAGYGIVEGIATADEMVKSEAVRSVPVEDKCVKCGAPMAVSKSTGSLYCSALCWKKPLPKVEPKEVDIDEIEINEVPF